MKNEQIETFENRLNYAMALRGKRQIDIANHFGWSRSTMSQYCDPTCKYKPKADRMYKIAEYLNVSPAWLMGYDVPMNGMDEREKLINSISGMDSDTLSQVLGYVEGLVQAKNKQRRQDFIMYGDDIIEIDEKML